MTLTLTTPSFRKKLRGHVWIDTVNMTLCVKFEVRSFNRFEAISIERQKI